MNQLELFPNFNYDNRIEKLIFAIKLNNYKCKNGKYNINDVQKCVKLFRVSHLDVIRKMDEFES